ncbi:hypothetical protein K457DRAFT_129609 [Linnemannia elongata AG-77]|uniref:Uncharacterized protein n=1 Tax=Linnemannia elongata AG-77 TaxID=1314771 RepID=A0A197JIB5_9FUNG|nr:hypothetical protein K457DRAFT_129609 [Linnemannia elongata AG-77]
MAGCYSSSASAPLHALANQFLGESTFSAKSSLFRPSSSSTRHHHQGQGQGQGYHPGGLFPRQHQRQQQLYAKHQLITNKHKTIDDNTPFEHVWSTSSSSVQQDQLRHHYQADPWATQFSNTHQRPILNQRHLQDLDLISSWDHAVTHTLSTTAGQHAISSGGGGALLPGQELSTEEFDAYFFQPPSEEALTDSLWAQEMVHTEPVPTSSVTLAQGASSQTEDDDDEEDEFREEWNNDHFTQAYINTHQSQFRQIEEQDRLKEARLAEERERQRVSSGGPPRSSYSWMMTGVPSSSTAMDTVAAAAAAAAAAERQSRLRVPGLDSEENLYSHSHSGNSSDFCVSEFESFKYTTTIMDSTTPNSHHCRLHQEQPAPVKPIRAEDRFLSLVNDLHLAEQTYYPPASSATVPSQDLGLDLTTPAAAAHHSPPVTVSTNSAWAQEFATAVSIDGQYQAPKKFLGAEWNWEKIFGKDPRKQLDSAATTAAVAAAAAAGATMDGNERLKAVALARLQAVFKHLTLAPSSSVSPP